MKLYTEEFINEIITNMGISKEKFREIFPNDEDLLFAGAKEILNERKINANKYKSLFDFINDYESYGSNNARLLELLQAIELLPEIKKLNNSVAEQRVHAFRKIIERAIKNGEISKNAIEILKIENIINLFFEIIDDRVAKAVILHSYENKILLEKTQKLLNIYYKFLSKWDEKEDSLLKFAKFVLDYNLEIKECIMDQTLIDIISSNTINYEDI